VHSILKVSSAFLSKCYNDQLADIGVLFLFKREITEKKSLIHIKNMFLLL